MLNSEHSIQVFLSDRRDLVLMHQLYWGCLIISNRYRLFHKFDMLDVERKTQ